MKVPKRKNEYKDHRKKTDKYYQSKEWKLLRRLCLVRDSYLCQYCNERGIIKTGNIADHVTPRNAGGKDELSNLKTCCESCHAKKSNEDKKYYN